jgi:hypothetical protein
MSQTSDIQNKTYGSIAAMQTIVNSYPKLNIVSSILDALHTTSPLVFILNILRILGITQTELVEWLTKILCGDGDEENNTSNNEINPEAANGLLNVIEYALKGILFANIKDMFLGCEINPLISSSLLDTMSSDSSIGINVPIDAIDMFGILDHCPINDKSSIYYFDCKPSIFGFNYTPEDLKYSTDFNAFLWHVINRSGSNGDVWDNRNFVKKYLLNTSDVFNAFFNQIDTTPPSAINPMGGSTGHTVSTNNSDIYKYKPILRCQYINTGAINEGGAVVNVTLPTNTYVHRFGNNGTIILPRTIFEFNYDFIFGLKLFNSKTLVANIINAMLGLSTEIHLDYSVEKQIIRNKVKIIIQNLIKEDGTETEALCATSFSNKDYDDMLTKSNSYIYNSVNTYNNSAQLNATDIENIINKIQKLETSSSVNESLMDLLNTTTEIFKNKENVSYSTNFGFDLSFIYVFIEELMAELVLQILSPKVMFLYYINTYIMGSVTNMEEWKEAFSINSLDEFFAKFSNLIITSCKQIIDILVKQLLNFLLEKISPMLKILTMELLLETIRDYKDLIIQLITVCGIGIPLSLQNTENLVIDDVRYADIVPILEVPNNDC